MCSGYNHHRHSKPKCNNKILGDCYILIYTKDGMLAAGWTEVCHYRFFSILEEGGHVAHC